MLRVHLFAISLLALANSFSHAGEPVGGLTSPTLLAPECLAIPYAPVPVFRHANGVRLGTLKLEAPELAKVDTAACDARPRVMLHMRGAPAPIPVELTEVGYEDFALAVFSVRDLSVGRWVRGKAGGQYFWMPISASAKLLTFEEDLVQGVHQFDEVCVVPGQCMQAPAHVIQKIVAAGRVRDDTCYGNAYDLVDKVRGKDGRLYYYLQLPEGAAQDSAIPPNLWVPARTAAGAWTGFFYPRGC